MPDRRLGSRSAAFFNTLVSNRVTGALQAFIQTEASSGIAMLVAAVLALAWANSPWRDAYFDLWQTPVSLHLGSLTIERHLAEVLNEGLMTLFFFLVGLEIKRELVVGELAEARKALLPVAAALGGMAAPGLIYLGLNPSGPEMSGWGIPTATDIALSLGVLSLLGARVPLGLKVFLLAFAIVDDIGAIVLIAVFYTSHLDLTALAWAAAFLTGIITVNRLGLRNVNVYVVLGVCLWLALLLSGIHATLAGVALGLLTPAMPYYPSSGLVRAGRSLLDRFERAGQNDERQLVLRQLEDVSQGTEAPLDRFERRLHPWVSYAIVPLFVLANAGIEISPDAVAAATGSTVTLGVIIGLVLGKPLGILVASWLAVRSGIGALPAGASWPQIAGVGALGGVGFTVAIFLSNLAFEEPGLVEEAKLGVLVASVLAAGAAFGYLRFVTRQQRGGDA